VLRIGTETKTAGEYPIPTVGVQIETSQYGAGIERKGAARLHVMKLVSAALSPMLSTGR
jgi:hypothetical protein